MLGAKGLYGSSHYRTLLVWWNSRPYSAIADPFKTIRVDPDEIIYVTGRGPNPGRFQWQDLGTVQGGDWDRSNEYVADLPVVQALRQRFENDMDWVNIGFIQHVLEQVERGNIIWRGCASDDDVWNACAQVDRLYERIREQGYRSKQNLVLKDGVSPHKYSSGDQFNRYDEVVVDVGRDGQFLFVDGRHRLTIAKILNFDDIPVRISARHSQWQQIREMVAGTADTGELPSTVIPHIDHPDLTDLDSSN